MEQYRWTPRIAESAVHVASRSRVSLSQTCSANSGQRTVKIVMQQIATGATLYIAQWLLLLPPVKEADQAPGT